VGERYTANWVCVPCSALATARSKARTQEKNAGRPKPGKCECCGARAPLVFDHDHKTGNFRGWLCHPCNLALGHVNDSPQRLRQLAQYLEAHAGAGLAAALGLRR